MDSKTAKVLEQKAHRQYKAPLWLLAVIIGLIGFNLYSVIGTLDAVAAFAQLDVPFSAAGRIVFAVFWIILLGGIIVSIVRRRRLAFMLVAPTLTLYGLANVLWTLAFARSDYSRGQIAFQTVATVVALIPVWWVALRRGWVGSVATTRLDSGQRGR